MKVIAKKGTRVPRENNFREYITDSEQVDVLETAYYKRLIEDGSLVNVEGQRVKESEGQSEKTYTKGGKR